MKKKENDFSFLDKKLAYTGGDVKAWAADVVPMIMAGVRLQKTFDYTVA